MKKTGWKVFWIICGCLAAVGIFLTAAGAILGGFGILHSDRDENILNRWLWRPVIVDKTTVSSEREDIDAPGGAGTFTDSGYVPGEVNGDTIVAFDGISELDIELTGLGVCVQPYDGDSVIADTSGCRDDLQDKINVWQEGSELKIEMEDRGRLATENSGIMYISVPQGKYFRKISADAVAGLIEIKGVEAKEISASADAGQVIVSDFSAERLEAECNVGEIILDGEVTSKAEIDCDMGDIQCTLPGAQETYDYEIDCDLGDVIIDGESYSSIHHRIKADNGSGCKIEADCNMGTIEIMFK